MFNKILRLYKDAYSGLPREIWELGIFTLINRLGMMVIPFLSVYLKTILKFSLAEAGLLLSALGWGALAGSFLGGQMTKRFGHRITMVASLIIGGVMLIIIERVEGFYGLFIVMFLTFMFGESYRPAMSALIGQLVPKNDTGRSMAVMRLAMSIGMSIAPAIGGFIATYLGYEYLFWVDGITCILAGIYLYIVSAKWEYGQQPITQQPQDVESAHLLPYQNTQFLLFLASSFFIGFVFLQYFYSVPVFIKTEWGFDERYIGILMGTNGLLVALFELPLVHTLEKNKYIYTSIIIGIICIAGGYIPFLFFGTYALGFVSIGIWTLGIMLFLPFNNSIPVTMAPQVYTSDYMAWYWMAWAIVGIAASSLGLVAAAYFGFQAFWLGVLALAGIGLFLFSKIEREKIE